MKAPGYIVRYGESPDDKAAWRILDDGASPIMFREVDHARNAAHFALDPPKFLWEVVTLVRYRVPRQPRARKDS